MARCPECRTHLRLPPTTTQLHKRFPYLPLAHLDRDSPRCLACDESHALNHVSAALNHTLPLTPLLAKLAQEIEMLERCVEAGGELGGKLGSALEVLCERWCYLQGLRRDCVQEAWEPFWGVWGVMSGQAELC